MTILIAILIIGFLVFIHELGHFVAAKRAGVLVEEFGIGFPPRLFSVKRGETVYSINALPLGGFVKIYGETEEFKEDEKSFVSKSIGVRTGIVFAGVMMNFLVGMFLLIVAYSIGFPSPVTEENKQFVQDPVLAVAGVLQNSPASVAGLKEGDIIISLNGKEVDALGLKTYADTEGGKKIDLIIKRGSEKKDIVVTPRKVHAPNEGALGIALVDQGMLRYPFGLALLHGIKDSFVIVGKIIKAFFDLLFSFLRGHANQDAVSGPVGVFVLAGHAVQNGIRFVLPLIILITFNLGVMNALPFPALDGGRILFFLIERIKGKPVPSRIENLVHGVGFAVLIILMIVLTVGDLKRFF